MQSAAEYIAAVDVLTQQAVSITQPAEFEIQAAIRTLSQNPVLVFPRFTESEVRLIGAYRAHLSRGASYDPVWRAIVQDAPEAWTIAVHEATELQAFADRQANPFDWQAWQTYFEEAHLQALVFELQYLREWARQDGQEIPELALEMENPFRQMSRDHRKFVGLLQSRYGWASPSDQEKQEARSFWQNLLQGGMP
jgi:hypothetical protein